MLEVSVVVPTLNRREMTLRAVRSALAQTRAPLEILVCDGGSTDGTQKAVESLGDARVRLVSCNGDGPAPARNAGLEAAKGDLIAFLDSDDEWMPEKLEEQAPIFEKNESVALVFSDAHVEPRGVDGRATVFSRQPPSSGDIFFALLLDNFIATSTVIVPRRADALRFRGEYSPAEDYDFWLRASRLGRCTFRPEPLAIYHRHTEQFGADPSVMHPACVRVIKTALSETGAATRETPDLVARLWRLHRASAAALRRRGKLDEARAHLREAVELRPADVRSRLRLAVGGAFRFPS